MIYFDSFDSFVSREILKNGACVDLKQKSGYYYLLDDPIKSRDLLKKSLNKNQHTYWNVSLKNLQSLTNDTIKMNLVNHLFADPSGTDNSEENELQIKRNLMFHFNNTLCNDKTHIFSIYIDLMMVRITINGN